MVRNSHCSTRALALAIVLAFVAATTAQANDYACSNHTLFGTYSALLTGTSGGLPFAALDLVNADGAGHLSGTGTTNVNGTVTSVTIEATYVIHSDCSGMATFTMPSPATQNLNVKLNGSLVNIIRTGPASPGTVVSGTAHRLW